MPQTRSVCGTITVSRETAPGEAAVLTVGSITAGTKSNVIADHAVLQLNIRTYSDATRTAILGAIRRIVVAECHASGSPRDLEFDLFDRFPPTVNDPDTTTRVAAAFTEHFGDRSTAMPNADRERGLQRHPHRAGVPYTYWGFVGIDPDAYRKAEQAGRISEDIPVNHSAAFAPVVQLTLDTGTEALVVAALAWL
ncbi:amidohydrolase [Rhodococcus opacus]|nr:amidohydrolase [Rhodococcus opacus]